jgi:5-methylcytosine-specific restriction protein A
VANAPPRACKCGARVAAGQRCERCSDDWRKRTDEQRGTAAERGYNSRWRKATATWRSHDPQRNLCAECLKSGRLTPARITDHVVPHKGSQSLFWDTSNWQTLCRTHHAEKTAREDGGFGNKRATVAT